MKINIKEVIKSSEKDLRNALKKSLEETLTTLCNNNILFFHVEDIDATFSLNKKNGESTKISFKLIKTKEKK